MDISEGEYRDFRAYLERTSGIVLGDNKQYLVRSRLTGVVSANRLGGLAQLTERLIREPRGALHVAVIDAMTTNETYWFRDEHPFAVLAHDILPTLAKSGSQAIRIWSAACSTGQEPYSISMVVSDFQRANPGSLTVPVEILATDISHMVLKIAEEGVFDEMALARGLSADRRRRFFDPHPRGAQVKPEIRARVRFREFNLLDSYGGLGRFDAIFCRNVLIYFSQGSKVAILERMQKALRPGGFLVLGASESVIAYSEAFEMMRSPHGVAYRSRG